MKMESRKETDREVSGYPYETDEELGRLLLTLTNAGIRGFRIYPHWIEPVSRHDPERLQGAVGE